MQMIKMPNQDLKYEMTDGCAAYTSFGQWKINQYLHRRIGVHLRPIWNPDTADLIGDPWIRQGLNPSVDETLLPKRKIKIRNITNFIKGELVKKMLHRKIQVNLKTKDIPVRCKWTVSLTRLLEIVLLLNDDLWCWKQVLAHGHHHNKFNLFISTS